MCHCRRPFQTLAGLAAVLYVSAMAAASAAPAANAPAEALSSATQEPAQYAGESTCLTCHETQRSDRTAHGRAADARSPAAMQGCESCHGPGRTHAETGEATNIRSFRTLQTRDANATCTSCHSRGAHTQWSGSVHDARNVSCVTCHSVHSPKSAAAQLSRASQIETCAQCHKAQVLKTQRSAHMPLREGKLECASCHNPHGSTNVKLLKAGNWVNEACVSCHAEKRGPFLWEHAAGRESCVSCHDPHGSSNDRMLVAKLPMLCQRCHIGTRHPSTIYDSGVRTTSNRLFGRSCVNCHQNIHGSNHPAGHTFLR